MTELCEDAVFEDTIADTHNGAPYQLALLFVRHGATEPNLAGLRCGGDLDVPLTDVGRQQAASAGVRLAQMRPPVGLIVTSDLLRTRETAAIIARHLPGVRVVVEPAFAERRLGQWNLRTIAETQPWFEARLTPPGGESDDEFVDRVAGAVRRIKAHLPERPVLVGSKGVARVMGELIGRQGRLELDNGVVELFDFAQRPCLETEWGML
jgi:2,3-bisphosphoglycerate-dependent phosphoglycerate mutase